MLAKLHIDSLVSKSNLLAVRNALEKLPTEFSATYDEAMERIRGQIESDRRLAERVLCWIVHIRRPLYVKELQHALAVTPQMTDMDFDAIEDELILTDVCAGLIVVDEGSDIIQLVRESRLG